MDKYTIAKGLVTFVCLALFFLNSYNNAAQYFDRATTTTMTIERRETARLPVVTICNHTGFKQAGNFAKTSDYLKNTIEPKNIFKGEIPELKAIYGRFLGRCYAYRDKKRVKREEWGEPIQIQDDANLRIFIHPGGDETGHYLNYWQHPLAEFELIQDMAILDLQVVKKEFVSHGSCKEMKAEDGTKYRLTDCLMSEIRKVLGTAIQSGRLPNCTVVWVEHFKGEPDPDDSNACSIAEELQYSNFLLQRMMEAYQGYLGDCPVQCKKREFQAKAHVVKKVPGIVMQPIYNVSRGIFMFFTTTDLLLTKEVLLMSPNAFISSIGGSLGLFLGFSALTTMTLCMNQMRKRFGK